MIHTTKLKTITQTKTIYFSVNNKWLSSYAYREGYDSIEDFVRSYDPKSPIVFISAVCHQAIRGKVEETPNSNLHLFF